METKATILSAKPETPLQLSLSVSKVKTFKDCKAKFRFCYLEKLPRKDWDFHVFGKFLHEVLENFHKKIIDGSSEAFNVLMTVCFQNALNNWKDKITAEQKKESWEILFGYLKQLMAMKEQDKLPTMLAVEKDFYINIDDKVLLNGFIDRIQLDPDGVLHVADYKTTKDKRYLKNDYFQLLTYAYVMCLEDPNLQKVRTSYILLRHNFETIVKEFSREEVMGIEDKFLEYASNINQEQLWRPNPTPLCRFCDYLDMCPEGSRFADSKKSSKQTFGAKSW
jgi:putative RecB family exonuclease